MPSHLPLKANETTIDSYDSIADNLYYTYSQIYQLSYAMPLYKAVGGVFLVKNFRKWIQFKKYLRGMGNPSETGSLLRTPPVHIADSCGKTGRTGVIITPSVEKFYPNTKGMLHIFTGHGSGDKPYLGDNIYEKMATFDFHFLTGPKNLEKLKDKNVAIDKKQLIKIGNMRFDDYVTGRIDRIRECERLGILDLNRKNILYAPTWKWGQGSLDTCARRFCETISPVYNLIIRPHAHDRMKIAKLRRWAKKRNLTHVYFSNPSHLGKHDTMNDFVASDLLISDRTSSIIYEYLITGKPIIVIGNTFKETHKMPDYLVMDGVAEQWDTVSNIVRLIDHTFSIHTEKKSAYQTLLNNCFYHNDGKSTQRAVDFLKSIIKGLI